jgi:hypothetical protein
VVLAQVEPERTTALASEQGLAELRAPTPEQAPTLAREREPARAPGLDPAPALVELAAPAQAQAVVDLGVALAAVKFGSFVRNSVDETGTRLQTSGQGNNQR